MGKVGGGVALAPAAVLNCVIKRRGYPRRSPSATCNFPLYAFRIGRRTLAIGNRASHVNDAQASIRPLLFNSCR